MANTIDADLLLDTLSTKAINYLGAKFAPLSAFSTDFTTDELVQTKSVQVPVISAGSTTQTNPSTFESGDSTTSNVAVTVNHYSNSFHITSKEFNQRFRLEQLAEASLKSLANKISDVYTALFLVANTTAAEPTPVAQASFTAATAKTLWGLIPLVDNKTLLLDGPAYAQLAPSDKNSFALGQSGSYGFDSIHLQTRWTGATANTYGLAAGKEFLAMAAGIPMQAPGVAQSMIGQRIVTIPGIGISVQLNLWVSTATRQVWGSYDIMFGAAIADPAAGVLIQSA